MIDTTQRRIFKYLESNRIHPSLLLTGPNAESKLGVAIEMAKFIFCSNRQGRSSFDREISSPEGEVACGQCSDCYRVNKRTHPDLLVFGLGENGEEQPQGEQENQIKIENVREMIHHMQFSSHEGKAKICILDEAHRMNPSTQNAFLKTLEEPQEGCYFFLLSTQPGRLLSTVQSRCLTFSFKPEAQGRLLSEEERQSYMKLFSEALQENSFSNLQEDLSDKIKVLQFVRALELGMREKVIEGKPLPGLHPFTDYEVTRIFDTLVELEGRLLSNANPNLMLENFLEKTFLES